MNKIPRSKDKPLFTPGPLTTSTTVKQSMLTDLGSRDEAFIQVIQRIRRSLVRLAGADEKTFTAIPIQGSGTFGLEAVVSSAVPPDGTLLVAINGAYGHRIAKMAELHDVPVSKLPFPEDDWVTPESVCEALKGDEQISHVCVVHCETTTGIVNPVKEIGQCVREEKRFFFVDAMSSFGAVPLDVEEACVDYLVSSANKCIEGVPGFSFVLARLNALRETKGWARTLSLDLLDQYNGLERNGQFRFTPPTHAMLAFDQALRELEEEGGVEGRANRYRANHDTLLAGMRRMGFKEYLSPDKQSHIITSFLYPDEDSFQFESFYDGLNRRGYVIYPGKVSSAECFRIGTIGRLFPSDVADLLHAISEVAIEMGLKLPSQ